MAHILGVGTDIVHIDRVAGVYAQFPERFLTRHYTVAEQQQAATIGDEERRMAFLAKRFAVKEAVSKALGTGIGNAAAFTEIETVNNAAGQPHVQLSGQAEKTLQALGNGQTPVIHLSLSHDHAMAVAFVVIATQ